MSQILFRFILLASFSLWFGGFIFYVSFVVPIGTEVLGSARTQGFITQLVTHRLNIVCGIAVTLMLAESALSWKRSTVRWRWSQLMPVLVCLGCLGGLVWIHPIMDRMVIVDSGTISNERHFYWLHRVYLWLSTLQWAAGCVWLPLMIASWKRRAA